MQQIQERSNHDWFDRAKKKKPKTLKLESDQVVISNVSKLQAQKKNISLCSWNLNRAILHWNNLNKKKKSIPDDKNKTQKLSYIVKKEKSILQKEDLQNKLCKLFKRRKQQTKNT